MGIIESVKDLFRTPDMENLEGEMMSVPIDYTNERIHAAEAIACQITEIMKDVKPGRQVVVKERIKAILALKDI